LIALSIRLEIARRNASGRANIVVPRSPASLTVPPASEASSQTASTEGSVSVRGSRLVSGGQAARFSRALALIIAAPFSAIMIGVRRADRRHQLSNSRAAEAAVKGLAAHRASTPIGLPRMASR
jgi:hypothetical protein